MRGRGAQPLKREGGDGQSTLKAVIGGAEPNAETTGSRARLPGFMSQFCHSPAMQPWAGFLTSLCLGFPHNCKIEQVRVPDKALVQIE